MKYQVWYMKPSFFRGIVGDRPDPHNLSATHVHLKDVEKCLLSHGGGYLVAEWRG